MFFLSYFGKINLYTNNKNNKYKIQKEKSFLIELSKISNQKLKTEFEPK